MREPAWFRPTIVTLAAALAFTAIWTFTLELIRQTAISRAQPSRSVEDLPRNLELARTAASMGLIRGDLWGDYALLVTSATLNEPEPKRSKALLQHARDAAELAVRLAPLDSQVWLLLAQLDFQLNSNAVVDALKMAYYTGPHDTALIPERLRIATKLDAISSSELQILVGGDLRSILLHSPELKPSITAAYNSARPEGKHFIEETVKQLDPALMKILGDFLD